MKANHKKKMIFYKRAIIVQIKVMYQNKNPQEFKTQNTILQKNISNKTVQETQTKVVNL